MGSKCIKMSGNKEKAMEFIPDLILNGTVIFKTENYTVYDNGIIGRNLVGLTNQDIILDLVDKLQQAQNLVNELSVRNEQLAYEVGAKTEELRQARQQVEELKAKGKRPLGYGNEASFALSCMREDLADLQSENTALKLEMGKLKKLLKL